MMRRVRNTELETMRNRSVVSKFELLFWNFPKTQKRHETGLESRYASRELNPEFPGHSYIHLILLSVTDNRLTLSTPDSSTHINLINFKRTHPAPAIDISIASHSRKISRSLRRSWWCLTDEGSMKTGQATAGNLLLFLQQNLRGITKSMSKLKTFASTLRKFREDRFTASLVDQLRSQQRILIKNFIQMLASAHRQPAHPQARHCNPQLH